MSSEKQLLASLSVESNNSRRQQYWRVRALSTRGVNLLRSATKYARVLAVSTRLKAHGDRDLIFQDARGCPTVQVHIYIRVFSYSTYDHEVGVRKLRSPRGCILSLAGAIPLKGGVYVFS